MQPKTHDHWTLTIHRLFLGTCFIATLCFGVSAFAASPTAPDSQGPDGNCFNPAEGHGVCESTLKTDPVDTDEELNYDEPLVGDMADLMADLLELVSY